jgi:hypothetical protein
VGSIKERAPYFDKNAMVNTEGGKGMMDDYNTFHDF